MSLMLLLASVAGAAEVVWIAEPQDPAVRAAVLAAAGAEGAGRPLEALPGLAEGFTEARDGAAMDRLEATLREVRPFEQRLDGELLIMRDLADPIAELSVLRDDHDRERAVAALAYQGFAVERFFHGILGEDERAAPFRARVGEHLVPAPWRDAIALAPDRAITAYEIAEAPQRVAYEQTRARLEAVLPATLALPDRPAGVDLVVDGRTVEPGASAMLRVRPGRHFAHLERDGRIVARWSGVVASAERVDLPLALPRPTALRAWVRSLDATPSPPPGEVAADLAAVDDEVWLVDAATDRAWVWTAATVQPVALPTTTAPEPSPRRTSPSRPLRPTAGVALGAGWLGSHDYYRQDPVGQAPDWSTVNAGGGLVSLRAGVDRGRLRLEAGADLWWTPGEAHVARWGDRQTRVRAFPHLAVGLPEARLALGWLTPHHLAAGPRLALPLGRLELVGHGTVGLSSRAAPAEGTWSAAPIVTAGVALGLALGPREDQAGSTPGS